MGRYWYVIDAEDAAIDGSSVNLIKKKVIYIMNWVGSDFWSYIVDILGQFGLGLLVLKIESD
jgi:hypothetical protein